MINLLPPDLKEQIRYSKMNRIAIAYLRVTAVVVVVLAGVFAWAMVDIGQRTASKVSQLADDQKQINDLSTTFLPKAMDASERLSAIKYVQASKTKYSAVIADIAKVMPQGVKLEQMILTGDATQPMTIAIQGPTYDSILAFRDGLVTSPRISGADISAITQTGTSWSGTVIVGFKPGMAQ